jgi:hypothetical protein
MMKKCKKLSLRRKTVSDVLTHYHSKSSNYGEIVFSGFEYDRYIDFRQKSEVVEFIVRIYIHNGKQSYIRCDKWRESSMGDLDVMYHYGDEKRKVKAWKKVR